MTIFACPKDGDRWRSSKLEARILPVEVIWDEAGSKGGPGCGVGESSQVCNARGLSILKSDTGP